MPRARRLPHRTHKLSRQISHLPYLDPKGQEPLISCRDEYQITGHIRRGHSRLGIRLAVEFHGKALYSLTDEGVEVSVVLGGGWEHGTADDEGDELGQSGLQDHVMWFVVDDHG